MSDPDRIKILARVELQRTDWKLSRALERSMAGPEWCDWRDLMREIASNPERHYEPLPPEPDFGSPVVKLEPAFDPPPEAEAAPPPNLIIDNEMLTQRVADLQAGLDDQRAEIERLRKENEDLRAAMPPPEFAEEMPEPDALMVPTDLREEMSDGETISDAKRRLFPLLTEERQKLKNEEALIGKTIPRRERVEKLLGMLARVGETK